MLKNLSKKLVVGFIAFVWLFLSSCTKLAETKNALLEYVIQYVPIEADEKLGEVGWKGLKSQLKLLPQADLQQELQELANTILAPNEISKESSREISQFNWKLYIAENEVPNAFALPGGTLVFHTGFFEFAKTADEFFGVLAHEIGHVTERHGTSGAITQLGFTLVLNMFLGDLGSILGTAAQGVAHLTLMQFSRDQETRADLKAVEYLTASKLPHSGILSFFERLNEKKSKLEKNDAFESFEKVLSTHPLPLERVEKLRGLQNSNAGEKFLVSTELETKYQNLRTKILVSLSTKTK